MWPLCFSFISGMIIITSAPGVFVRIKPVNTYQMIRTVLDIVRASLVVQLVKSLPAMWETWVWSLSWENPWRRKWQPTPLFLPGKSHGWRSLAGYSPWGSKESDTTERLHFHFLSFMSVSNLRYTYLPGWIHAFRRRLETWHFSERWSNKPYRLLQL